MLERYTQMASRVRVPSGFALAAMYLFFAQPTPARLATGVLVALAGLAVRAASAGHVQKNRRLATGGPYAYTRNPLYLGSVVAATGFAIAGGRWWFCLLLALFFAAVYFPVMRSEQAHLTVLFGEEYAAYARAVPLLLPRWTPWRAPHAQPVRFDVRLYRNNREYEALLAFVVIVLLLWSKMLWWGKMVWMG
ncbi:MAG: isoprenylcysteine carboxylmethyltransferase family protein [Acidobacteria bacterium]|nr:isoprenylcysteine carboxylmethyltransferase family protein [Acidobacteriota bacterium]